MKYIKETNFLQLTANLGCLVWDMQNAAKLAEKEAIKNNFSRVSHVKCLYTDICSLMDLLKSRQFEAADALNKSIKRDLNRLYYQKKAEIRLSIHDALKFYLSKIGIISYMIEKYFKCNLKYLKENPEHECFLAIYMNDSIDKKVISLLKSLEETLNANTKDFAEFGCEKYILDEKLNFKLNIWNAPDLYKAQFQSMKKAKDLYIYTHDNISAVNYTKDIQKIMRIDESVSQLYEELVHLFTRCNRNMQIVKLKNNTASNNIKKLIGVIRISAKDLERKYITKYILKEAKEIKWYLDYISMFHEVFYKDLDLSPKVKLKLNKI